MEVEQQAATALAREIEAQLQTELQVLMQEMTQRATDLCTQLCSKRFAQALEEDRTANVAAAAAQGADFKVEEAARASAAMLVSAAAVIAGVTKEDTLPEVTAALAPPRRALNVLNAAGKLGKGKGKGKEGGKEGKPGVGGKEGKGHGPREDPGAKGEGKGHATGQGDPKGPGAGKGKGKAHGQAPPNGPAGGGKAGDLPVVLEEGAALAPDDLQHHGKEGKEGKGGKDGKQGKAKGKSRAPAQNRASVLDAIGLGGLFG